MLAAILSATYLYGRVIQTASENSFFVSRAGALLDDGILRRTP